MLLFSSKSHKNATFGRKSIDIHPKIMYIGREMKVSVWMANGIMTMTREL